MSSTRILSRLQEGETPPLIDVDFLPLPAPMKGPLPEFSFGKAELLSETGFSTVKKAKLAGHMVAVKEMSIHSLELEKFPNDKSRRQFLENEVRMHDWLFRHTDYVVPLLGYYWNENRDTLTLVTKYKPAGSLCDVVNKSKKIPSWPDRLNLLHEVAHGVEIFHELGIAHGDLKPDNILISYDYNGWTGCTDYRISFCDFAAGNKKGPFGTVDYASPEYLEFYQLASLPDPREGDIHALCLILVAIINWGSPWNEVNIENTIMKNLGDEEEVKMPDENTMAKMRGILVANDILDGVRPEIPAEILRYLPEMVAMLQAGWHQNPAKRPSARAFCEVFDKAMPEEKRFHLPEKEPRRCPLSLQNLFGWFWPARARRETMPMQALPSAATLR